LLNGRKNKLNAVKFLLTILKGGAMQKKKLLVGRMKRFKAFFVTFVMVMFSCQMAAAQDVEIAVSSNADEATICVPSVTECSTPAECGIEIDDCGEPIDCGECAVGYNCVDNICEEVVICVPETECSAASECGTEPDGCPDGGTIDCGTCDDGFTCNAANICEETPDIDCACDDDWKNHGQYVKCVAHATGALVEDGLITEDEKDDIVSDAAESDCGSKK
jgi:hypothetical protein